MTTILYNNINPFSGIAPTPLVSQKNTFIKYGEQWGEVTKLSLYGVITGICVPNVNNFLITQSGDFRILENGDFRILESDPELSFFNTLIEGQQQILSNFGKDFQSLQIFDDNNNVVTKPYCIVRSINFPQSNYVSLLPFQIDLDCYESNFFSGVYGILDPKNEFSFTQNKDQSITIQHSMSCRGFNTSSINSNSLQNAKNYIASISGFSNQIAPAFINVCSGFTPSLITQKETIDRVNGLYGVEETYIADPFFTSGVLRYSATYDSGIEDGISTVKIGGSLKASRNYPISFIRDRYNTFNSFSAAVDAYSGATYGLLDLNPFYLSSGISEDAFAGTINFDILFNNDQTPNPYIDYSVNFNHDLISDTTVAAFQGIVKGRGDLNNRYKNVLIFSSGVNIYGLTATEYANNGYQYILNPFYSTSGVVKNPYDGTVSFNASFDDKVLPVSGFSYFDYSYAFVPALEKYSAVPQLNGLGSYVVTDLGYFNRPSLSIQGKAVINQNLSRASGVNLLNNYVNLLAQPYINGKNRVYLASQEINWGNSNIGKSLNFNVSWNWEESAPLII